MPASLGIGKLLHRWKRRAGERGGGDGGQIGKDMVLTQPDQANQGTDANRGWFRSPRQLTLFALLLCLAPLGNALSVELFYGVEFIFGSIAMFIAVARLGLWPAVAVGLAGGLQTLHAWGHPVALVTFTLEALVVAGLYRRGWHNLVIADLAFWLALGVPLVLLGYLFLVDMPPAAAALVAIKQPLNGLFNALVASLLLLGHSQLLLRRGRNWTENPGQLSGVIFHVLLAIILVAGAVPTILQGQHQQTQLIDRLEGELSRTAERVAGTLAEQSGPAELPDTLTLPAMPGESSPRVLLIDTQGRVVDSTGHARSPHPACQNNDTLFLWKPGDVANPMLRATQGVFCLSRPVPGSPTQRVVVETSAAAHVEELKRESRRPFLLLAGIFLVGLSVAWWLSRTVTTSLTRLSRLASETTNGVVVTDADIKVVWVNEAFTRITGYAREEAIGRNPGRLLQGPESSTTAIAAMRRAIREGKPFTVEALNYERAGQPYWVEISSSPMRDQKGRIEGFIAVQTDISQRKRSQLEREQAELRLRLLIDQFPGAVLFEDTDRRLIVANRTFTQTFRTGLTPNDLIGMDCQAAARQAAGQFANPAAFLARIEELIAAQRIVCGEKVKMSDGHAFERDFIPVHSGDRTIGYLWLYRDVTERSRIEENLREAAIVFESAAEGILITDAAGNIIDVNRGFERISGYGREDVIGRNPRLLKSGMHDRAFYRRMFAALETEGEWSGEIWNRGKEGNLYATRQTITAILDERGRIDRYLSMFSDITELKEYQSRLEHIAHFDPLTNLPNRELLADRLKHAMSQAERRQGVIGVGFIDLDGFKQVNDTLGHDAGDTLLKIVARRLAGVLRDGDTLARIGGDEFVAVLVDLPDRATLETALERLIEAVARPMDIHGEPVVVSASVGATTYPRTGGIDADQLVREADQAMYAAKRAGKNRYHLEESTASDGRDDEQQSSPPA